MKLLVLTAFAFGLLAAASPFTVIVGTGKAGFSDTQVANPYGLVLGPDGALYFCDVDNQRIRRFDLKTRRLTTIAGAGQKGYTGDGGPAISATLNMPHELRFDSGGNLWIAERDNHVIRKIDMKTGVISTAAGTGVAGFGGDGGPATKAQLRQPHSIFFDRDGTLLICDLANNRIRRLHPDTGIIETWAGDGTTAATPDNAPVHGTPLRSPRTIALGANGDLFIALREGNAIYRVDADTQSLHHLAGTGEQGYAGDGGPALTAKLAGPKGLEYAPGNILYLADTESHTVRRIDLNTGVISTILGDGSRDLLARPHGLFFDAGTLYVSDSENNRILAVSTQ